MIMFLVDSKIECMDNAWNLNAWIMHGCECMVIFLVGNKMDYIAWLCDFLVGNKMDVNIVNAWLYFLWVTRWIILHGDFLVGNKMDVNVAW